MPAQVDSLTPNSPILPCPERDWRGLRPLYALCGKPASSSACSCPPPLPGRNLSESFLGCELSAVSCRLSLSLIIPVDPRNSPVSPIIPVHTQKQGGRGRFLIPTCRLSAVDCKLSFSPNSNHPRTCANQGAIPSNGSTVDSLVRITHCLLATKIQYVGAPTYCNWLATGAIPGTALKTGHYTRKQRPALEGTALHERDKTGRTNRLLLPQRGAYSFAPFTAFPSITDN